MNTYGDIADAIFHNKNVDRTFRKNAHCIIPSWVSLDMEKSKVDDAIIELSKKLGTLVTHYTVTLKDGMVVIGLETSEGFGASDSSEFFNKSFTIEEWGKVLANSKGKDFSGSQRVYL